MSWFMLGLLVIVLISIVVTSSKLFSINEGFQEYIYIPPQSVISADHRDNSAYMHFLFAQMQQQMMFPGTGGFPQGVFGGGYGGYGGGYGGSHGVRRGQPLPNDIIRNAPSQTPDTRDISPDTPDKNTEPEQQPDTLPDPNPVVEKAPETVPAPAAEQPKPAAETPDAAKPKTDTPDAAKPSSDTSASSSSVGGISITPIPPSGTINIISNPKFITPSDPVGLEKPMHQAGSMHISMKNGFDPSKKALETAFSKVFPGVTIPNLKAKCERFFNWSGMADRGTYNIMLTSMRIKIVPIEQWENKFDCKTACLPGSRCFGPLKFYAMEGNLPKLKEKLKECGGGDWISKLTDDDLMWIFGSNEHRNLHTNIQQSGDGAAFFNAAHCSSLNYLGDREGEDDCPTCTLGWHGGSGNDANKGEILGGMNDTGNSYQWVWYEAAMKAKQMFPIIGLS